MDLNERQVEAVTCIDGPLLIIAGAGSGKTRVVTRRICEMIASGIDERHILALTFTNKAAGEMRDRVGQLLGKKPSGLTVATFHAFGVKLLREYITLLRYTRNFSIYDQVDKASVVKEAVRELGMSRETVDIAAASNLFSTVKTERETWNDDNAKYRELFREYGELLHAYNAVDFDDLIMLPLQLFKEHPEVLASCRKQYTHILVDEFQDTSLAQYRIVRHLATESRNLCVVGDDDQSIYSWRGASFQNITRFETDFPERREIKLEQNYRSASDILAAANGLIANNTRRKTKELWTGKTGAKSIELFLPEHDLEEGRFIARTIKSHSIRRRIGYDDFGILVRTNSLMDSIEDALVEENVPYRVSGGTSFFQRKEVKDVISYLKVIANPDDDVSLLRTVNVPRRGIGKTTLQRLRSVAESGSMSLFSAMKAAVAAADSPFSEKTKSNIEDYTELIERYGERLDKSRPLAKSLQEFVDEIDYWGCLIVDNPDREEAARFKYRNVLRLADMLHAWESDPDTIDPDLYGFLRRIALVTRDDIEDEPEKGKVNLMTIHAAKGLEFDTVFVAGVEDGTIPHARAIEESQENIEEERRLFYVALTRAKSKLILTSCRTRRRLRQIHECVPSPFLSEIPGGLIVTHEVEAPVEQDEASEMFARLKARIGTAGPK